MMKRLLTGCLLTTTLGLAQMLPSWSAELNGINIQGSPDRIQVVLDVTTPQAYKIVQSRDGFLEMILPGATLPEAFRQTGLPPLEHETTGVSTDVRQMGDSVRIRLTRASYVHLPFEVRTHVVNGPVIAQEPTKPSTAAKPATTAASNTPKPTATASPRPVTETSAKTEKPSPKSPLALLAADKQTVNSLFGPVKQSLQAQQAQTAPSPPNTQAVKSPAPTRSSTLPASVKPQRATNAEVVIARKPVVLGPRKTATTPERHVTSSSASHSKPMAVAAASSPAVMEEQLEDGFAMPAHHEKPVPLSKRSKPTTELKPGEYIPTDYHHHPPAEARPSFFSWAVLGYLAGSIGFILLAIAGCAGLVYVLRRTVFKPKPPSYVTLAPDDINDLDGLMPASSGAPPTRFTDTLHTMAASSAIAANDTDDDPDLNEEAPMISSSSSMRFAPPTTRVSTSEPLSSPLSSQPLPNVNAQPAPEPIDMVNISPESPTAPTAPSLTPKRHVKVLDSSFIPPQQDLTDAMTSTLAGQSSPFLSQPGFRLPSTVASKKAENTHASAQANRSFQQLLNA